MDVKVTIGISERFFAAVSLLAGAMQSLAYAYGSRSDKTWGAEIAAKKRDVDGETVRPCEQPAEPQNDAQAQSSCEPAAEIPEPPVEVAAPEPDPTSESVEVAPVEAEPEAPKPKKSRKKSTPADEPQKAAPETQQNVEEPPASNLPPEPQNDAQAQASCESEPEKAKPADGDPYHGMTLLRAVQNLLDEIAQKGLELADVNARVRKECESRGLAYTSAACLMKAIGYDEARRIALGD